MGVMMCPHPMNSLDRKCRSPSTPDSEVHVFLTEHVTASQSVAARNPLSYRSTDSQLGEPGREVDYSTNARVPILARLNHLGPRQLDKNIQLE